MCNFHIAGRLAIRVRRESGGKCVTMKPVGNLFASSFPKKKRYLKEDLSDIQLILLDLIFGDKGII